MSPSSRHSRKLATALAIGGSFAAIAGVAPAQAAFKHVPGTQRLVTLKDGHAVFSKPDRSSTELEGVLRYRPLTGVTTTLPVLGAKTIGGHIWLQVRLPGRPNSHTGWISGDSTRDARTPWKIRIDTSKRLVTVLDRGRKVKRFRAIVGKPSTPTPTGRFFVEENVRLHSGLSGSPFALALSARSNVFQEFEGGPGQIAIHGLGHVGGTIGTAVSHGCVRLNTRSITWLARRVGPGVPVTISR
jgi:lipoprotein-anchoring transpeptidase ErfK/SrfK